MIFVFTLDVLIMITLLVGFCATIRAYIKRGGITNSEKALVAKYISFSVFVATTFLIEAAYIIKGGVVVTPPVVAFLIASKLNLILFTGIAVLHSAGYKFGDKVKPV